MQSKSGPVSQIKPGVVCAYVAVGPELRQYAIDFEAAALELTASLFLPGAVQYAWPDRERRFLYVVSSNGGPMTSTPVQEHFLSAFSIDPDGGLQPHGKTVALRQRPIHVTLDGTDEHIVCTYNRPSAISVHHIDLDGSIGAEVEQENLKFGIFAHQTRISPMGDLAITVTRGHNSSASADEEPGALNQFRYGDGRLGPALPDVAVGGGFGFGPRHLDFHTSLPRVFVGLERQNEVHVYGLSAAGLTLEPLFRRNTLEEPNNVRHRQMLGAIHVHPNGRYLYVSNRAEGTVQYAGTPVFLGGENSMAVFSIDPVTGEPTLIQHSETFGIMPRTFAIDPSGRLLLAANQMPMNVRKGNGVEVIPASLVLYRIRGDGRLDFVRKYDIDTGKETMFWMGIERIPPR